MKMPSVHHEISMKISWVIFPKSDFGMTVLIGVSQFQPTALQELARSRTAPSRQASVQSKRLRGWGIVAGGSIMGLLSSFLGWPDARVERVAGVLGAVGQKTQALLGSGVSETVGFALFLGLAYLIYRTALKAR